MASVETWVRNGATVREKCCLCGLRECNGMFFGTGCPFRKDWELHVICHLSAGYPCRADSKMLKIQALIYEREIIL